MISRSKSSQFTFSFCSYLSHSHRLFSHSLTGIIRKEFSVSRRKNIYGTFISGAVCSQSDRMCSHRCFCCFFPGIRVHSVLFLWADPWKKRNRDAAFFPERNFHGKKCSTDFAADQYADRDLADLWFHCVYRILCIYHLYPFRDAAGRFSSVLSDLASYRNLFWKCRYHRRDLYDYGKQYGNPFLSYQWCDPGRDFFRGPMFSGFHQCTSCQRADKNGSFFQYPEYDTQCSASLYSQLYSLFLVFPSIQDLLQILPEIYCGIIMHSRR